MIRIRKKENGSGLVMVLGITMVLSILSIVICTAVIGSSKGNQGLKEKNDLFYSAESGLIYGRVHLIKNSDAVLNDIPNVGNSKTINVDDASTGSVKNVSITYKRKDEKSVEVKSTAIDNKNNKKEITMTMEKNNDVNNAISSRDIYSNGLVSTEDININLNGSVTLNNTTFLVGDKYTQNVTGSATSPKLIRNKYSVPEFSSKFKFVPSVDISSNVNSAGDVITILKNKGVELKADGSTNVPDGIGYFQYKDKSNLFDIILVNTGTVNWDLGRKPLNARKYIIITNGDIKCKSEINTNIMFTNWGTIFGKSIGIEGTGSVNINSYAYSGDLYGLTVDGMNEIDKIISHYIMNWNKDGSGNGNSEGSENSGWEVKGEIIY